MYVCKVYVIYLCFNGVICYWNYSFCNEKDWVWLLRIKLDQFIEEEFCWFVLILILQICVEYNNGICQDGFLCIRIYMCIVYLLRCCKVFGCGFSYEEIMRSEYNREVFDWYQVIDLDLGYFDQFILMNEELVKKGDIANLKV